MQILKLFQAQGNKIHPLEVQLPNLHIPIQDLHYLQHQPQQHN